MSSSTNRPRDQVLEADQWPSVNAAFRASVERSYMLIEHSGLDELECGVLQTRFDLLCSDYSAGRDLGGIRDDFAELMDIWAPAPNLPTLVRGMEVGTWCRAFGLEQHLPLWRTSFQQHKSRLALTDWILGVDDPWDEPDTQGGRPQIRKDQALVREMMADLDNAPTLLEDYVRKRWYRNHTNDWWWNAHKHETLDEIGGYYGYWAWGPAAAALILGIDDSALKDAKYYPWELVHYLDNH